MSEKELKISRGSSDLIHIGPVTKKPMRVPSLKKRNALNKEHFLEIKRIASEIEFHIPNAYKSPVGAYRYNYIVNEGIKLSIVPSYISWSSKRTINAPELDLSLRKIIFDDDGSVRNIIALDILDELDNLPEEFKTFFLFNPHLV